MPGVIPLMLKPTSRKPIKGKYSVVGPKDSDVQTVWLREQRLKYFTDRKAEQKLL